MSSPSSRGAVCPRCQRNYSNDEDVSVMLLPPSVKLDSFTDPSQIWDREDCPWISWKACYGSNFDGARFLLPFLARYNNLSGHLTRQTELKNKCLADPYLSACFEGGQHQGRCICDPCVEELLEKGLIMSATPTMGGSPVWPACCVSCAQVISEPTPQQLGTCACDIEVRRIRSSSKAHQGLWSDFRETSGWWSWTPSPEVPLSSQLDLGFPYWMYSLPQEERHLFSGEQKEQRIRTHFRLSESETLETWPWGPMSRFYFACAQRLWDQGRIIPHLISL